MEKFNTWADSFTGIQPFLPIPSERVSGLSVIKWFIIVPVVAIIRQLFLLPSLALLLALDFVGNLIPIGALRRSFLRLVHSVLGRLVLFFMGFIFIEEKYMPSKKGHKAPSASPGSSYGSGHVIIANHNSYVELFYLLYKFSPQFTAAPVVWKSEVTGLVRQSFWEALMDTIYQPERKEDNTQSLTQCAQYSENQSRGPVIVFPEATTTNGKVLLGCAPIIPVESKDSQKLQGKIHIVAFKYDNGDFSPIYTAGSFFWHLFFLSGQFSNTLQVRYMLDSDIDPPNITESRDPDWSDRILSLLAATLQKQRAKITAKEKQPFLVYYSEYRKGYKR